MVNNTEDKTKRAEEQARAQLKSIINMVARFQHCNDCDEPDPEECELTDAEIYAGLNLYYEEGNTATEEEREQYHDQDSARQAIEEDPLSVQLRSGWYSPGEESGAEEYEILLCTGGPACRITGDLGNFSQPDRARIEYQDWFTPWIELVDITSEEREALLTYARVFYYGE